MKNYKIVNSDTTIYFINGIKKYQHSKGGDGYYEWKEFDEKGNEIYFKNSDGYEIWWEFDERGNKIYYKDSNGCEVWREFDGIVNETYSEDSDGFERRSDNNPDNPNHTKIEISEDFNPFKE